jgi:cytoskeletal protein CcmA (bactofilin family)
MSDQKARTTLIEQGTAFQGTLHATCPILARGKLDGDVTGPSLEVTETGHVAGKVKVTDLRSQGELNGRFEADDVVLAGHVRDKTVIVAKALEVTSTVTLESCEFLIGEPPSKAQALRAALEKPPADGEG